MSFEPDVYQPHPREGDLGLDLHHLFVDFAEDILELYQRHKKMPVVVDDFLENYELQKVETTDVLQSFTTAKFALQGYMEVASAVSKLLRRGKSKLDPHNYEDWLGKLFQEYREIKENARDLHGELDWLTRHSSKETMRAAKMPRRSVDGVLRTLERLDEVPEHYESNWLDHGHTWDKRNEFEMENNVSVEISRYGRVL